MMYRIEIWGGNIQDVMWDDVEKLQKSFIHRYLGERVSQYVNISLSLSTLEAIHDSDSFSKEDVKKAINNT